MKITIANHETHEVTARAKAFTGRGVETLSFSVTTDDVRPFDRIAGHYTTCHSLSPAAKRRIRSIAA